MNKQTIASSSQQSRFDSLNIWVYLWFPTFAFILLVVLSFLEITGSSTGVHFYTFGTGSDPQLVWGSPRPIRSDEWLVQQSWVVAQAQEGYPVVNMLFPGGTNMSLLNELPNWDWSTLFRPHLWGYLLGGINFGAAWFWWFPAFVLLTSVYLFGISYLPQHPFAVALVSSAIFFTPMLQWWYTPTSAASISWPFLCMAAIFWALKSKKIVGRLLLAGFAGYFAISLAMGLYFPFIFPGVIVTVFYLIGMLGNSIASQMKLKEIGLRLLPLLIAAFCTLTILTFWIYTRLDSVLQILNTAYPGQRSEPTGNSWNSDPSFGLMFGGPWNGALRSLTGITALGGNQSEASGYFLLAIALIPGCIWLGFKIFKLQKKIDWLIVSLVTVTILICAFMYVPGWDSFSHLLFFDRVPAVRFRISFVILGTSFWIITASLLNQNIKKKDTYIAAGVSVTSWLVLCFWYFLYLKENDSSVLESARFSLLIVILLAIAIGFSFFKKLLVIGAGLIFIASLLVGAGVNPLYRGVFDLRDTQIGNEVSKINSSSPGVWISAGSASSMAMLMETGVRQLSGVQPFPSVEMWKLIDPTEKYKTYWNRLGHIHWHIADGPTVISNPQPDVIEVSVDPCSPFAQTNIKYLVSDQSLDSNQCLKEISSKRDGNSLFKIFEIVPG